MVQDNPDDATPRTSSVRRDEHQTTNQSWQPTVFKVSSEQHEKGFKPHHRSQLRSRAEQKVQNLQSWFRF